MPNNNPTCNAGFNGSCCCNCKNQIELHKHPCNKDFGNSSITENCGWVCMAPELGEGKYGIYFDNQHGMCEMYQVK